MLIAQMWHLTACKILVSLSFLKWIKNVMIFIGEELLSSTHDMFLWRNKKKQELS